MFMRRGPLIVTSLLLNTLKQRSINDTSFRPSKLLYYFLSVPFKRTNNFSSMFTGHLDRRIYEHKFSTDFIYFFPTLYFTSL
jgi:hypothetical protein